MRLKAMGSFESAAVYGSSGEPRVGSSGTMAGGLLGNGELLELGWFSATWNGRARWRAAGALSPRAPAVSARRRDLRPSAGRWRRRWRSGRAVSQYGQTAQRRIHRLAASGAWVLQPPLAAGAAQVVFLDRVRAAGAYVIAQLSQAQLGRPDLKLPLPRVVEELRRAQIA